MTERLYYRDCYLTDFRAAVTEIADGGLRVYLDRTAFYPSSGGQPHDTGTIWSARVVDVVDEDGRIAHLVDVPIREEQVECRIDWRRRFDHMQQHTGQHLLSAVLVELYGYQTVGFHLGAESASIDIATPTLEPSQATAAIKRANQLVFENRPVTISFEENAEGLRKASERAGTLRIVTIDGFDRSACGGTHVRATGEIGPIQIRKLEKAHGSVRVEFLCGMRAVVRSRADYDALSRIARAFSSTVDETPGLVAAQAEALEAAGKTGRKLAAELAGIRGRELYAATEPDSGGLRRHVHRMPKGAIDDELRAMAQGFTAGSRAFFLALIEEPPTLLLAVSQDAGVHAGNALRQAVSARGGRGGGNALVAQGSVPSRESLQETAAEILALPKPGQ